MNYWEATCGTFRVQPSSWAAKALAATHVVVEATETMDMVYEYNYSVKTKQDAIVLGNHTWFPNFVSFNPRYGSMSAYWLSEDGQYLLRLSDHWSEADKGQRVKTCGNIRACWWSLAGHRVSGVFRGKKSPHEKGFFLGIIKLSDLVES